MTSQEQLINRIMAFDIDEADVQMPLTSRLAREQTWTHAFSWRVVTEYKRFIVLAMIAGHPVTPSEQVDQVWHLHLLYTRSYWHYLCRDILGQELHHGPTKGGTAEGKKFFDWYRQTLESYERIFKDKPPLDIWPKPKDRFKNAGSWKWYNSSHFILVRIPTFLRPSYWFKFS